MVYLTSASTHSSSLCDISFSLTVYLTVNANLDHGPVPLLCILYSFRLLDLCLGNLVLENAVFPLLVHVWVLHLLGFVRICLCR